ARTEGVDVRAVTVWSLLGSFDWNSLVTVERGHYEPGVFDLRAPVPRPTALARMVQDLARVGRHEHPVLDGPGWWRRRSKGLAGGVHRRKPRPLAIVGASGTLGRAFVEACAARGLSVEQLDHARLDLTHPSSVERALGAIKPWAVINAAGYVRVDMAERELSRVRAVNAQGPAHLAEACRRLGCRLLTFSSDLVFDGDKRTPYVESDPVGPLSAYGRSKVEAEERVAALLEDSLIVRTSAFFGAQDEANFITRTLCMLLSGQRVHAVDDVVVSATYVPHLTHACLELLIDGARGIWHLANQEPVTWYQLAERAARLTGISTERLLACKIDELGMAARRPAYSVLSSERAWLMPLLDEGLAQYAAQVEGRLRSAAERTGPRVAGAR
ncbi:MAG: hypothetical protein JWN48_1522, partial [Myxococcaceae bacterium]|nr:hypothetical protein [Myxococcaceae bacterium]